MSRIRNTGPNSKPITNVKNYPDPWVPSDPDPDSIRCDVPDSTALKTEKLKKGRNLVVGSLRGTDTALILILSTRITLFPSNRRKQAVPFSVICPIHALCVNQGVYDAVSM